MVAVDGGGLSGEEARTSLADASSSVVSQKVGGSGTSSMTCRLCLCDEPADAEARGVLIAPCACTTLIHPQCLKRWQQQQVANGDLAKAERCEVCQCAWRVRLISKAERLRRARCWVYDLQDDAPGTLFISSALAPIANTVRMLAALKPGMLIVQTPALAARGGKQTNCAARAQQGEERALAAFTAVPSTGSGRLARDRALWSLGCLLIVHVGPPTRDGPRGNAGGPVVAIRLGRHAHVAADMGTDGTRPMAHELEGGPCHRDKPLTAVLLECASGHQARSLLRDLAFLRVPLRESTLVLGEPDIVATSGLADGATVKLHITGVAVWSIQQLADELADGRWGLCRATPGDVLADPTELWRGCWRDRRPLVLAERNGAATRLW